MRPPRIPKYPAPEVVTGPRVAALAADAARPGAVEAFWADVARSGAPLVEPSPGDPGHRLVTFLWRDRHGTGPGTRDVLLLANKLTDPSVLGRSVLERLPGTDVWHRGYRLRADWRATYQLAPDDGPAAGAVPAGPPTRWGAAAAHAGPDPLNPRRFPSRYGDAATSIVELPDAPAQPWCAPRPGVAAGTVTAHRLASARLGNERDVWLYVPPGLEADGRPADVLVLLDGEDWATRLPAATILDNLIAAGALPPTVAVMPATVDNPTRWRELAWHPPFVAFLQEELLPWAAAHAPITTDPARTTLAGRSLGGLTALFAGLRAPGRFGRVLSQSASLWWPGDDEFATGTGRIVAAYAAAPRLPLRLHLEVGLQEWALLGAHHHLRDVLALRGYDLTYREYHGGHDALCWQGGLADGLLALTGA